MKKEMLTKAAYLTQLTKRVQWQNAELNYELKRPVSAAGKNVWIEERGKNIKATMENLAKEYGLIFFFSSNCPYCHRYAPIIKSLGNSYGLKILGISLDGKCLTEFLDCRMNRGESEVMGVTAVPTTLLFNKSSGRTEIIGTGILSITQLEERIYKILKIEVGDDY